MPSRRLVLLVVLAAALLGPAGASPQVKPTTVDVTTFVITGHGWGHGVGMAQWGAYGYAKHGVTYGKILAHYYPGTTLAPAPVTKLKVLLVEGAKRVVVSSQAAFKVQDASGAVRLLPAGEHAIDPSLGVVLGPARSVKKLPGPLTFLPGKSPLELRNPYRGSFTVSSDGKNLTVVNTVALEAYTRGVVSSEMPHDWPVEAVKAQAVAARSYALAHRRGGAFDVYNDTRDQVYGGILAETPVGDEAVAGTKRQVLLYAGKVANTFFFSSSGGRTADVTDVFGGSKPIPYLVSVPDPWDTYSPYHNWGPVVVAGASAAKLLGVVGLDALQPLPAAGHAKSIVATGRGGDVTLPASDVRRALGLRSTWMSVGVLSLSRPVGVVPPESSVTISGRATKVQKPLIEQKPVAGGTWQPGPSLSLQPDGTFSVDVAPTQTTQYRLSSGVVKSGVLQVAVAAA
jgi:stage II sporulation protein D